MERAVNFVMKQFLKKKFGILGDYDVDGASSSALIFNYLSDISFNNIEVFIPDRQKDGYGLSKNAVKFFLKKKVKIIVCLDCATNDKEIVRLC